MYATEAMHQSFVSTAPSKAGDTVDTAGLKCLDLTSDAGDVPGFKFPVNTQSH